MADAQNQPIHVVPDPKDGPAPAPAEDPPKSQKGGAGAALLGIALVGSLAGNGFQYVQGDALQTEALGWARYGFGAPSEIAARAAEIRAISPRTRLDSPT